MLRYTWEETLLYASTRRKPGWRFTAGLKLLLQSESACSLCSAYAYTLVRKSNFQLNFLLYDRELFAFSFFIGYLFCSNNIICFALRNFSFYLRTFLKTHIFEIFCWILSRLHNFEEFRQKNHCEMRWNIYLHIMRCCSIWFYAEYYLCDDVFYFCCFLRSLLYIFHLHCTVWFLESSFASFTQIFLRSNMSLKLLCQLEFCRNSIVENVVWLACFVLARLDVVRLVADSFN